MNIKTAALSLLLFSFAHLAQAESNDLPLAIVNTRAALVSGQAGQGGALEEYAKSAMQHANASVAATPNDHTQAGINQLNAAIDVARKGDLAASTSLTKEALRNLQRASGT